MVTKARAPKKRDRLPADPPPKMPIDIPGSGDKPEVWQAFWKQYNVEPIETYLAGGRSVIDGRNWRRYLEERLPIIAIDPFRDSKQDSLFEFVTQDIEFVRKSKLIIACYFGGYASHGMAAEMGIACEASVPIFYVDESEQPDMFLVGLSKRFFPSLEAMCQWWARRAASNIPLY